MQIEGNSYVKIQDNFSDFSCVRSRLDRDLISSAPRIVNFLEDQKTKPHLI